MEVSFFDKGRDRDSDRLRNFFSATQLSSDKVGLIVYVTLL